MILPNGQSVESDLDGRVARGSKNPLWTGFAYRLSSLRCAAGLTADAVNKLAGLSKNVVNSLEDRLHRPKLDTVEMLAAALGVSPCWLAFGPDGDQVFTQKLPQDRPVVPDPAPRPGADAFQARYAGAGKRIRDLRVKARFSLRYLAGYAKVSHQAVLYIEQGTTIPKIDTVEAIAVALGVAPCWLAYGDDEAERSKQSS